MIMRRSNRNLHPTTPPPPRSGKPRAFNYFLCPAIASGEFDLLGLPGDGDLTFARMWWGKLNRKCRVSNSFFFFSGSEVANSYKYVFVRDGIN